MYYTEHKLKNKNGEAREQDRLSTLYIHDYYKTAIAFNNTSCYIMNVKTTTDSATQSKHGLVCDKSTSDNSNDYTVPIELLQLHHCMAMSQSGEERTLPVSVTCCYV